MMSEEKNFCFCTLAFGKNYRSLALLLARDIEKYSPNTYFVILSDRPKEFSKQSNVLAFKHRQNSVKIYHDKRFVLAKALSMFRSCIYIDADMRIVAPVPQNMKWLQVPGITARSCEIMRKKYTKVFAGTADYKLYKQFIVTNKAAQKLNLGLESEEVKFIYEYLFAITKDSEKELEFIKQWEKIAPYFELNRVHDGEGNAIGLAAAKAGLQVRWSEMEGISFFKDKTELIRIKKGQSNIQDMALYFEQQKMLEYPKKSILQKFIFKITSNLKYSYNLLRLIIVTLCNFDFYYQ
jgi:chloramphenicol O-acetyltransferase